MKFMGRDYYVALLTAAAFEEQVMADEGVPDDGEW